jgi:5-methylcytosine-specific restriction endonuclease McrA
MDKVKWAAETIFRRDGFKCVYCCFDGSTFEGWRFLVVDHLNPYGGDDPTNLVTSCSYCNLLKGDKICWEGLAEAKEEVRKLLSAKREYWESNIRPLVAARP